MSLPNRLILPVISLSLAVLAGCGGTSNPVVTPPPSGSFTNSNLTGTYVFSVTGTMADSANDFVTIMGAFTADGKGNITGGVIDQNSTAGNSLIVEANITSGTYSVGSDGRPTGSPTVPTGLITLQAAAGTFLFDYVLTSSEHGLVTEFDNFGSASGTLDLQSTVTQANIDSQSFAFNFSGASGFNTVLCNLSIGTPVVIPYSTVGDFTLDANGNISAGLEDFNNNCVSSGSTSVPVTGGSVTLTAGSTFGTATISTTVSGTTTTYKFDVFPIDATHLKFIEVDALPIVAGDAFTQASSIPTGNNVYTVAGFDNSATVGGPFTAAGILHADGSGTILSDSVQDINDAGAPSEVSVTGTYTSVTSGRAELTLSGFINGNGGIGCSGCLFAVYPSSGGLQMLEIDNGGMTNGIAYAQTATTLASSEGYGMNLSGATSNTSEDDIAEFTNNNGAFSGIIDVNDQGSTNFKNTFSANYAADSTVAGRGTVTPTKNGYLLTTYVVDSSTAVAVSTDPGLVALGALVKQNATAKSSAIANHLIVLSIRPSVRSRAATKKAPLTR